MKKTLYLMVVLCVMFSLQFTASTNSNTSAPAAHPRQNATVEINFDGLLALCFGDSTRVSAGILDVPHHTPELAVTKITGGHKSIVGILRADELRGATYINIEGQQPNVSRYYAGTTNDVNDFGWNIDMEGDLFQRKLYIREEKLFGKVHFGNGLFYAANLGDEVVKFQSPSGNELPFQRRVGEPAAKINLQAGETLVIKNEKNTLRLAAAPDTQYLITVHNLPPVDMASMDHFLFYYDLLGEKVTRYNPVMVQKAAYFPKPMLCTAVVFSKSKLN